jgi:hypothetical protein
MLYCLRGKTHESRTVPLTLITELFPTLFSGFFYLKIESFFRNFLLLTYRRYIYVSIQKYQVVIKFFLDVITVETDIFSAFKKKGVDGRIWILPL